MTVPSWFRAFALSGLIGCGASVAFAGDAVNFMGQEPTSDELVNALTPVQRAPKMRGLRLNVATPTQTAVPAPSATSAPSATPAPRATAAKPPRAALDIKFEYNSAELTPAGQRTLDTLAEAMRASSLSESRFLLEGHADATGSDAYNQVLSERRAQSARDYLMRVHGIDAARLRAVGRGETQPLDPANPTHWQNRRVEVVNLSG